MAKRIAVIEEDKCFPDKCGNYLCIRVCPVNRQGPECIYKAESGKAAIHTELCIGCMICPKKCPFGAIHIINLPSELEKEPIHQYGENGFHLYSLPTPIFGKVVGIVGRNGIGKSTAIKILAGLIQPNLGRFEKEGNVDFKEIINYFKGTEAQIFFEKLRDGKITIAYKPQAVDMIPKQFSGRVIDLLKKADQKDQLQEVIAALELQDILEHDIQHISGGELQRVAIAATALKNANVYLFDEPTSFLDSKQRIHVSRFIKSLADEETAVLVIEHDLIILDSMTDVVQIMYGEAGAYGIVSQIKATKQGINAYLAGYLKEENMRFRDHAIVFEAKAPVDIKKKETLTAWQGIAMQLDGFSLSAPDGTITKHAVIGVLGENGIGKTTFVKILAGVLKAKAGNIEKNVKVSYKPQYLSSDSEELVMNVLQRAVQKYDAQLIRPLDLQPLFLKKMNMLSGGELQRVAIAKCLQEDAYLYLLDEPSAYLDIEQRLILSKVLRRFMEEKGASALIVDHDVLFLDYISNELMVFEGAPAKNGRATGPFPMEQGMNAFLQKVNITMRRDPESKMPRVNKTDSRLDREQKKTGKWYYH
ncbi:ribosome biogenesis/translation initiation ATPase RLI [Candidatus Woesearchaeota archaeon]|nr:ribosome biogenesis/translation initiation ATPase RLI [Candidatus Woesearchaeota archaeon]